MYPNWCRRKKARPFTRGSDWRTAHDDWGFDVRFEIERQEEWAARFVRDGGMERYLEDCETPVVCVRGNHDFIPLAPMFGGCNLVHEFVDNEVVTVGGKTITGHRGIPAIFGSWNDEVQRPELMGRFEAAPKTDIRVTHYPLWGILDRGYENYGLENVAHRFIAEATPDGIDPYAPDQPITAYHLFGHIHEQGGKVQQHGNVLFSNAATFYNVIDV